MSDYIKQFRAENPAYDDMQDSDLVTALHGKFYSDIPIEQFNQKIGFQVVPIEPEVNQQGDNFIQASPRPEQQQPLQTGYGASSDIPIQEQQQIDGFTGADTKQPFKPMGELVAEKIGAIGEGIGRAWQNVLPQFKSQLGGLMQTQETPLLTPSEFYMNNQRGTINDIPMQFESYEDYTKAHEQSKGPGSWIAEKGKQLRATAKGEMQPSTAERGSTEYYIEQGLGSILNFAPTAIFSIATKRPDIGLGIMLAQVEGDAYGEGRDKGLSQQDAKAYASFQTVSEVIPSALPLSKLLSGSGIITQGLSEGAQEVVTAALQAGIDKGYINPEMTWGEAAERLKDAAIIGTGSGATMALATKPFAPKQDSYADDPLKAVAVEMEREAANKDIKDLATQAFDEQTANVIIQDQAEKQGVIDELPAKEQPKAEQIKPEEVKAEIAQEPIDQEGIPTQEPVAVELPQEKPTPLDGPKQEAVVEEVAEPVKELPEVDAEQSLPELLAERESQLEEAKENIASGKWAKEYGDLLEGNIKEIKAEIAETEKETADPVVEKLDTAVTISESEVKDLQGKLDNVAGRLRKVPGWTETGRNNRSKSLGKDIERLTNEEQKVFKQLQSAEKSLTKAKNTLSGYKAGTLHADGIPKSQKPLMEKANVEYSELVKTNTKAGDSLHNIQLNQTEKVIKFNKKTVSVETWAGKQNRPYTDFVPVKDGKPMTTAQIKEGMKAQKISLETEKPEEKQQVTTSKTAVSPKAKNDEKAATKKPAVDVDTTIEKGTGKEVDTKETFKVGSEFTIIGRDLGDFAEGNTIRVKTKPDDTGYVLVTTVKADGSEGVRKQMSVDRLQRVFDKGGRLQAPYTIESYTNFRNEVANQTATAESIKADAQNLITNKSKIIAEMSERKFTKAMLQKITYSPRSDLSKPQMVKQAYQQMLSSHVMADATVTVFGGSKSFEDQIIDQVRNQTQADVDSAYEKQREYRADRLKQIEDFKKSLANPETLPEFKEFIRVRGKDKMTAEQLKAYDELVSESLKPEDKPVVVTGETEVIKTERAQTTHSKTGADLFVVKMVDRVEKDKFRGLNAKAKQFGGYYSAYSKDGAIPGFQFKTLESADQFEGLLSGADVSKSDYAEAKAEIKQSKNAQKLLDMADKMEDKATEEINRPRQANTARRASMASNATERAEKQLALAKTVRNIGTRLLDGELNHLGKISQVTQLEELASIQRRAIPNDLYEHGSFDGYSISRPLKEGVTVDDYIANVEFPRVELANSIVDSISKSLKGKRGYARLSAELTRLPRGKREGLRVLTKEQADKIMQAAKAKIIESYNLSWLPDQVATLNRLDKLGIATSEQLRAAIRELDSMREVAKGPDPVKQLERALIGKKIPGFFPTPKTLVDQMIAYADIKAGHEVLEPSAGKGNIATEIKTSSPDAILEVVEYNSSLAAILEAKGFDVVGNDFLQHTKKYDRIVMNPPFENFQDVEHVKHAYELLKPGGKLVAIMGASVKNSRKTAVEFREWLDDAGSYIEDLPEGSFKNADRKTGVSTVMVTIEKNDADTLKYKKLDSKVGKPPKKGERVHNAPGNNHIGLFKSTAIPARRDHVVIDGRKLSIPKAPQRVEPIMAKLTQIMGNRIYYSRIKGKSSEGFYRPSIGEIRTRKKNDLEVLAHEMAHYLDFYSSKDIPNFQSLYKQPRFQSEVAGLSYTDADADIELIEGFAEFTRLWLTNAQEAQARAPEFYNAFNGLLTKAPVLSKRMKVLQGLMHKFYFQGPDKLGQALIGKNKSYGQRFSEWRYRQHSRIRQQMIDRFHAAREVEKELTDKVGSVKDSAWKQFRLANGGAESISEYILNYGTVNFDSNGDLKRSGKSLHEILEPVKTIKLSDAHKGDQKIDVLLRYFAGRRALELHKQGRENLIPKETAKEWARLGKEYPVFESIQKEYQDFNDRMMDFYEESGMITKEGRKAMRSMNKDYVPFNRIRDQLSGGKSGGSGGIQRLRGGTANLNDILVNMQDGIQANVRAALMNRAKQRLYQYISNHQDGAVFATSIAPDSKPVQVYGEEMQSKIEKVLKENGVEIEGDLDLTGKDLLTFWQHGVKPQVNESGNIVDQVIINGKPKYYEVQDPMLQEMLLSMNPESYGSFMNVMFGIKNLFTRSITLGIEFTGANLVRDTIGATFLSKNNFIPFVSSFNGMYSFFKKDKHYQAFVRSGGGYSGRLEASTREGTARRRVSIDEFGVSSLPEKLLSSIDNLASAFEYGTRIGEFKLAKKKGKSDMEAGFDAREISTDFSGIGANRFFTGYIRTVPFLNAMIQSQDRLFREAAIKKKYDGNPAGMAMKAFLGITIPSLVLYMQNKDDEDYQDIPDYEKRTNWHIKIPGTSRFVKIPRPYDVGFTYATMPELYFKYVEDENGKEFADGIAWTMLQMYGIDGVPAVAVGGLDLMLNKKWTGSPVVPQSLEGVDSAEQYTANTSETFVRLGRAIGLSPIKAEHAFKAYTGYLGGYLMAGTDHMLWDESKFGERPDRDLSQNVFLRRFLTADVRPASVSMEKFFNLKEQSDKIVSTYKKTVDIRRQIKGQLGTGKFDGDKFFGLSGKEKEVLFGLNDSMNKVIKFLYGKEGVKTAELAIKYDKKLSGAEKRKRIDALWINRNKTFKAYYNQANQALQKAKREAEQEK